MPQPKITAVVAGPDVDYSAWVGMRLMDAGPCYGTLIVRAIRGEITDIGVSLTVQHANGKVDFWGAYNGQAVNLAPNES